MSCLLIRNNLCYSKKIKYSNHLNTRRVWYLTGPNIFGCQIVWFLIGGLKTGQKHMFEGLKCLATRTFPFWFWMVRTMNQKRLTIRNPNTFRFWAPTELYTSTGRLEWSHYFLFLSSKLSALRKVGTPLVLRLVRLFCYVDLFNIGVNPIRLYMLGTQAYVL